MESFSSVIINDFYILSISHSAPKRRKKKKKKKSNFRLLLLLCREYCCNPLQKFNGFHDL